MEKLDLLHQKCLECKGCELYKTRTNCVFGTGNVNSPIMFVGEAPGEQEDLSGVPFVGRAGQLFDKFLFAVGLKREDIYIANILKCRPPKNRDPLPEEEDACMEFLREQVRIIRPKMIVCLGRISAAKLIKEDFKITKEHGVWFDRGDFSMCAIYHPAYLLRNPKNKEDMLVDMKKIKERYDVVIAERRNNRAE
jgi:DNA polymerase